MPKKKPAKKSAKSTLSTKAIVAAVLCVAAVVVVLFVWKPFQGSNSVAVTAPSGTTSRMDQLNNSEISNESNIDSQYDSQQSTNVQSDSSLLGEVSGTADEN